ncbi:MAG: Ig-like domain-containing protein [Myxococcales bacterium]|nr:Ig-like domain-containing protein [Myxococcales bacterium]
MSRSRAVLLAASILAVAPSARADGPGLPNLTYPSTDVFKVIGRIDATTGAPRGHGTMHMHRGNLAIVYAPDSGKGLGGFAFFDVSDPRAPKLVGKRDDDETKPIREGHGYGLHDDLVFLQTIHGFSVWDWSDPKAAKKVGEAVLPGIEESDYGTGAWWLSVQYPWVYLGGSSNGLYVVDVSDPKAPKLADRGGKPNPIPTTQLGGFRVGPTFAIGNLLVVTSMDEPGYATLDIGDPVQPRVLRTRRVGIPVSYSSIVNGNRIYGAGNDNKIHVHDIANPASWIDLGASPVGGTDKGGYLQLQDGFAHAGMGTNYAKFDLRDPSAFTLVGKATAGIPGTDEDFANVMGNLVFVSDDHGHGTSIVVHQAAPDTTPPEVNMVVPRNGAKSQPVTSRVGLTFTDAIDVRTVVVGKTFFVREAGTTTSVPGKLSYQTGILNFAPDAPLGLDKTYEVVVPEGGVTDLAGNKTSKAFVAAFSTGVGGPAGCTLDSASAFEVGKAAAFTVTAPTGAGLVQSWDFGDGSAPTKPDASPSATHTFVAPGHWIVSATVSGKDAAGKDVDTSCTKLVTVTHPLTALAPTRSSALALDPKRKLLYACNPDAGTLAAIATDTRARVFEAAAGRRPRTVAVAPDGSLWVADEGDDQIVVLDGATGATLAKVPLGWGAAPWGVAFAPDGSAAFASLGGPGGVARLDPKTRVVTATKPAVSTARGLAVTADSSRVLVTRFLSSRDGAEVVELDARTLAVLRTYDLGFDKSPDTEASGRGILGYLSTITVSPDGLRAFVPAKKDNTQRGLAKDGLPLTFESTVRTVLAQLDLGKGTEDPLLRLDFNDRSMAFEAVFSKLGDVAFVTTAGSNTVEIVDAYSGEIQTSITNAATTPESLLLDGDVLWVQGFLSRDVTAFDVKGIVDHTDGRFVKLASVKTVEKEPLPANVLLGKKIFWDAADPRMSKDKYLSCATCHFDGHHDGRTFDFTDRGEGLRNTISLLGHKGKGQAPLHWSANFDEVQDFEGDIRKAFGGTGFLPEAAWASHADSLGPSKAGLSPELDALAAYVDSLDEVPRSPYRNADGTLTDAGLDGLALFRSKKCDSCHAGADLRDGKQHDVGTILPTSGKRLGGPLTAIDTPGLQGVFATAPYLHDGRAETLDEVFSRYDPEHRHGPALTDDERQKLVAYLLQIDGHDDRGVDPDARFRDAGCNCSVPSRRAIPALLLAPLALALRRRRRRV